MRAAVTGSSGLIGAAVVSRLAQEGTVVTIGRQPENHLKADLADTDQIARLDLSGCDLLVHAAGVVDEDFSANPARALHQATAGASALFDAAASSGVARVAYISSAHVYGPLEGRLDETSPADPRSDYAIAHFATEQSLKRLAARFGATAAFRPCAVYGQPPVLSRFRRWGLVPFAFPRQAVSEGTIRLMSSGEQMRNFVAATDIADAIAGWASGDRTGWSVCNPVGISDMTVWEFARLCADVAQDQTGRPVEVLRPEGPHRAAQGLQYRTRTAYGQGEARIRDVIGEFTRRLAMAAV